MIKSLSITVTALLISLIVFIPVTTAMPSPAFATGNFTATSNVSIDFFNPTDLETVFTNAFLTAFDPSVWGPEMEDALIAAEQARADHQAETLASILSLVLCVLISALAFLSSKIFGKESLFLYLLAAPVDMVYGLNFAANNAVNSAPWVEGIIITVVGLYCLFHAAIGAWKTRKSLLGGGK
ncbi:MAG: hypothetical protein PHG35_01975 [Dehalococcoidales bacterium]|nr:hypothetical protein [Dehalococcoidales bacterium]